MSHWSVIAEGEDATLQAALKYSYVTVTAYQNSGCIQQMKTKDLIQNQPNAKFFQGSSYIKVNMCE